MVSNQHAIVCAAGERGFCRNRRQGMICVKSGQSAKKAARIAGGVQKAQNFHPPAHLL